MSQSMQMTQNQQASAKAEQLAGTYQLGDFQQDFGVKLNKLTLFCGIGLVLLAGFLCFISFNMISSPVNSNDIDNAHFIIGVAAVSLLGALYCFLYPVIFSSWHIYIYTEGFAFTRGAKVDAFRWEQVEAIWQSITRQYMNGIYYGTNYKYTIRSIDSKQVVLTNRITDIGKAGSIISDMVTRVKLPEMASALKAGSTLTFGPLSISLQSVSNGKESISWEQIKKFELNNGTITVQKEGKWLSWSSVQVAKISNFFIFMSLVNAILSKAI